MNKQPETKTVLIEIVLEVDLEDHDAALLDVLADMKAPANLEGWFDGMGMVDLASGSLVSARRVKGDAPEKGQKGQTPMRIDLGKQLSVELREKGARFYLKSQNGTIEARATRKAMLTLLRALLDQSQSYLPMDCPACGRHRLEVSGGQVVCDSCGRNHTEAPVPVPADGIELQIRKRIRSFLMATTNGKDRLESALVELEELEGELEAFLPTVREEEAEGLALKSRNVGAAE